METRQLCSEVNVKDEADRRLKALAGIAPWVLRITEHRDRPAPVLVVKERCRPEESADGGNPARAVLKDRGVIYGQALRRCLPVIRDILRGICDEFGIPLELNRFLAGDRLAYRGNLPLDDEAGAKLALIFKLQERLDDMDRVELIARRVERFSREEAVYWFTRATHYGETANRWAQAGMRIMLGGQPGDKAVLEQLERLRR